ncbi:hypothetical protein [Chromobacterium violaceum]|uniref:hypothetical protein n=1 Tax=Chromobacterium violaceum TaxID=536 RepID=UPI0005D3578C|nr:hypothetical protein [Chromobacterium violaceum]KJH65898.1 hypothetical protein UF16_18900 [Chromobacterium violaceum]
MNILNLIIKWPISIAIAALMILGLLIIRLFWPLPILALLIYLFGFSVNGGHTSVLETFIFMVFAMLMFVNGFDLIFIKPDRGFDFCIRIAKKI